MLDVIKELIPLLQGATDGVVWLVAGYFGLNAFKFLLIFASFVMALKIAQKLLTPLMTAGRVFEMKYFRHVIDNVEGSAGIVSVLDEHHLQHLLKAMSADGRTVNPSDLRRAIEKLEDRD